ncbi:MAG: hypothetical protein KC550_02180 [Nanoarchaeota archaeon]|nr:hypothetical protein [Nanoarchaeota archaeon]
MFLVFSMFFVFAQYDNIAQIYDSILGQDGNLGPISSTFNSQTIVQNNFSHSNISNSNRLYVNKTGIYKLSYSCTWIADTANARHIMDNWVEINGTKEIIPSRTSCYIRNNADGDHCSNTGVFLANLTNGDYIELRGERESGDTGDTLTTNDCFLSAQILNTRSIEVYDSLGGQDLQGGVVTVNMDNIYYNGDTGLYTLNNDAVNVSENGWYKISYVSCLDQNSGTSGSTRQSPRSWLRKNNNTNISYTTSYASYTRRANNGGDKNCNRAISLVYLNASDTVQLREDVPIRDSVEQIDTIQNKSWMFIEKIEMDSSLFTLSSGSQLISDGSSGAINFDNNVKSGNYNSHSGSSSKVYFEKSGLYEISYNVGYNDDIAGRVITCGNIKLNGASDIVPSRQCVYTRGTTGSYTGTISVNVIINVSKDDYIEIMVNPVGGSITANKDETWISTLKINETVEIYWNSSNLNLGNGSLNLGNLSGSKNLILKGEGNNNVTISCSGDCSRIIHNFSQNSSYNGLVEKIDVKFTCKDDLVGNFTALFDVKSKEDLSSNIINVSCEILQTYGNISSSLINPIPYSKLIVIQNDTFVINGTVSCSGSLGASCGNVSSYANYNISSTLFQNISTSSSGTPLWTSSIQPNSCVLNAGESCNVSWIVNASGGVGTLHLININSSSNYSQVLKNISESATINISTVPPGEVIWSSTFINLGSANLNLGNVSGTAKIKPGGNHSNVSVSCVSGNCSIISDDFIDGTNLTDGVDKIVTFTCLDNPIGSYWALFEVNSSEDSSPSQINVSCTVEQTYGFLSLTLSHPPVMPVLTELKINKLFNINSSIVCDGSLGASCGNVSANTRYKKDLAEAGDGSDGSLTVSVLDTIVNDYTYLSGVETSGTSTITVNDGTSFTAGDEILIIQMQDGSGSGEAGRYEFNIISSKLGNDLTLNTSLSQTYGSGAFDQIGASSTQIVRIPQYTNVTINSGGSISAPAWNGYVGGIVVFRAQDFVRTNGYINVSDRGFRGGDCNGCGNADWGDQGEGISGLGTSSTSANDNGGGGGYGPDGYNGEPGGGGGYGSSGNDGNSAEGFDAFGGSIIGSSDLSKIFFGGGAGAGGDNDNRNPRPENVDGAGIVMVFTKEFIDGRVHAIGEKGIFGDSGASGGVSGSGAGGTIWISALKMNLTDVNASGGSETNGSLGDVGGAGGNGRIRLDYLSSSGSSYPSAGYTSSSFSNIMEIITSSSDAKPFWTVSSETLSCGVLYEGDVCSLSWNINATGYIDYIYEVDVNVSSNASLVLANESDNSQVILVNKAIVSIISPENNSFYVKGSNFYAEILSDDPIEYAGYYLNGNVSGIVNLINISSTSWQKSLSTLEIGNYNITFIYNVSGINYTAGTVNFDVIENNYQIKVDKSIKPFASNMFLVELYIENYLNETSNRSLIDFVDETFNYGSFNYLYNLSNTTSGFYSGKILLWNLSLMPYEKRKINYSISGIGDYKLANNYIFGLD